MHFVKWIRKNNRKIMTFVVVAIMVAFVLGQGVRYLFDSVFNPAKRVIATYDDGTKIKSEDFMRAQNELTVLRMLMADRLLLSQSSRGFTGPLLVHLLMPDSQLGGDIATQMKQAVQQGRLPLTTEELDTYFSSRSERPEILWILLKNEAYRAGCIMQNESAAETLRFAIPQMTGNQLDAAALVNQIIQNNNIGEEQILRTFADLLGVLTYTDKVMDNQAVTINQIRGSLARSKERLDAEFVKIPAEWFIDDQANVSQDQMQAQFETYQSILPGNVSEDNPFGFGYKLPKRIQLEYMILAMDDVKTQIDAITAEDMESYYSNNIQRFQKQVPSDPNDPESEKITTTQSFAEVQAQVRRALEDEKTSTMANIVFNEIKTQTESGFETLTFDEASAADLQKAAGDYVATGTKLSQKYDMPITVGKTGWLGSSALAEDNILNGLSLRRGQSYLRLADLAFAATEEKAQHQRIGIPAIRTWENIGPLNGGYYSEEQSKFVRLMALVRVVGIEPAQTPTDINTTFDVSGVVLNDDAAQEDATFMLKELVKEDVLLLKAMELAEQQAQELVKLIDNKGWDQAIDAYNDTYAKIDENADPNETPEQAIELAEIEQQLRLSQMEVQMLQRMIQQNPASAQYYQSRLINNLLTNKLYALLDESAESTGTIQAIVEFGPQSSCYVVKEVLRQPATMKDYQDSKGQTALQLNMTETAGLVLTHLNPENITKRMNLQYKDSQADAESPEEESDQPQTDKG